MEFTPPLVKYLERLQELLNLALVGLTVSMVVVVGTFFLDMLARYLWHDPSARGRSLVAAVLLALSVAILSAVSAPLWQRIADTIDLGVLGLVLLGIGGLLLIQVPRRRTTSLAYECLTTHQFDRDRPAVTDRLTLLLDGVSAPAVSVVVLRFGNDGDVVIAEDDFHQPLRIAFADDTTVLSAAISTCWPATLGAACSIREQHVVVDPLILNPGDWFTLTLLVHTASPALDWAVSGYLEDVGEVYWQQGGDTAVASADGEHTRHNVLHRSRYG